MTLLQCKRNLDDTAQELGKIIRLCFIVSEQWNAMENTRLLRVNQSERTPFILWFRKMSIPPS